MVTYKSKNKVAVKYKDYFGRDEDEFKEFLIDDRTGDMFTRCDYCSKLHNELELTDVTHTITIAGEQSKRYSLICKPCEGKQKEITA